MPAMKPNMPFRTSRPIGMGRDFLGTYDLFADALLLFESGLHDWWSSRSAAAASTTRNFRGHCRKPTRQFARGVRDPEKESVDHLRQSRARLTP
jgi:hypothetical protein